MFKHILVPTDGSKLSLKAIDVAAGLANSCGAKTMTRMRDLVEKRAKSKSMAVQFLTAAIDQPHVAIIDTAKQKKCDLIVMASHGRSGLAALLLGSETTKVLTHCKLPVLVCR